MILRVKKLKPEAVLPHVAKSDDAGLDLYSSEVVGLKPGERAQVPTGIAMEIPLGHVGFIWDKSGLSQKHGLKTLGGVVDAGYRGEIMVGIINLGSEEYVIEKGHKVAQMILQKYESADIVEVGELSSSERGDSGFGSSGK